MHEKLFPKILKNVISEPPEIIEYAAQEFESLLDNTFINTTQEYEKTKKLEESIKQKIQKFECDLSPQNHSFILQNGLLPSGGQRRRKRPYIAPELFSSASSSEGSSSEEEEGSVDSFEQKLSSGKGGLLEDDKSENSHKKAKRAKKAERNRRIEERKKLVEDAEDLKEEYYNVQGQIVDLESDYQKIQQDSPQFFKCGLSLLLSNKASFVRCWISFVQKNVECLDFDHDLLLQVKQLSYQLMQKNSFDFSKQAGISVWVSLFKKGEVTFSEQELHLFVGLFNEGDEVSFTIESSNLPSRRYWRR